MKVNEGAFSNHIQQNLDIASAQKESGGRISEKNKFSDEIQLSEKGKSLHEMDKMKQSGVVNNKDNRVDAQEESQKSDADSLESSRKDIIESGRMQNDRFRSYALNSR